MTLTVPGTIRQLLEVEGLSRSFGGVLAVNNAGFTVPVGSITGLIGPNGAGKTTVLSMIAGSLRASSGSISMDGERVDGLRAYQMARKGVIRTFQIAGVFGRMTVLENLLVGVRGLRGESMIGTLLGKRYWQGEEDVHVARARELLARFELAGKEDEYAGSLSGGERRLVEVMRALMSNPKLLLLDEPTAGLSSRVIPRLEESLESLKEEGLTMLLIEHELGVVERLCDPIVVMRDGSTLMVGTMAEVRANRDVIEAYLAG
jgi:ABC-type branched-subunit amino acid transport system ATPase component